MDGWIRCSERMPEEHETFESRWYGIKKAQTEEMPLKESDTVLVTKRYLDGTKVVTTSFTQDGIWNDTKYAFRKIEITHWMPLPKPAED